MTNQYWGSAAAGILFFCEEDQTILLGLRSEYVLNPLTWGIPGGAVKGEAMISADSRHKKATDFEFWDGALNEVEEECGSLPEKMSYRNVVFETSFKDRNFEYRTFVYRLPLSVKKSWEIQNNFENEEFYWFPIDDLPQNLHKGVLFTLERFRPKPNPKDLEMKHELIENIILQKQIEALQYIADLYEVSPIEIIDLIGSVRSNGDSNGDLVFSNEVIAYLYKKYATFDQLKKLFSTSPRRIYAALNAENVEIRPSGASLKSSGYVPLSDAQVLEYYALFTQNVNDASYAEEEKEEAKTEKMVLVVNNEILAHLYLKNATFDQLHRIFHVHPDRIYAALKAKNVKTRPPGRASKSSGFASLSDAQVLEIYALFTQNVDDASNAEEQSQTEEIESSAIISDEKDIIEETSIDSESFDRVKADEFLPYAYEQGANFLMLSKFCKMSTEKIREILVDQNVTLRKTKQRFRQLSVADIQDIWVKFVLETSQVVDQVAEELHIDRSLILGASFEDITTSKDIPRRLRLIMAIAANAEPLTILQILILRQRGLSYSDISRAEFDMNKRRRGIRFAEDCIAYILSLGFPEEIDAETYKAAVKSVDSYLDTGKGRRRVVYERSSASHFHFFEHLYDLTPADTEFIIYLNQKYLLNIFEIQSYIYKFSKIPELREVFSFFNITPTRNRETHADKVQDILYLRNERGASVADIAIETSVKPEKVMFFIDFFNAESLNTKEYDSNGYFRGKHPFRDTLRNLSGEKRIEIINLYKTEKTISVNDVINILNLRTSTPQDIRSLLYIKDVPLRLDLEFPNMPIVDTAPPQMIEDTPPQTQFVPRIEVVSERTPIKPKVVESDSAPIQIPIAKLYPLPPLSFLDIERIVDLNHTFGLTLKEIERFEYIGQSEETLQKAFELAKEPYKFCSEVIGERAERISRNLKRVHSLNELASIYQLPIEKIKYMIRKRVIKAKKPETVSFDYVGDAKEILNIDQKLRLEVCVAYETMNTAEIAYTLDFKSRKDVRRVLHHCSDVTLRLREEYTPISELEEFGN